MIRRILIWSGATMIGLLAALVVVVRWLPQLLPATLPNPWAVLSVKPLRGGVYWLQGGVSNTGFIVGPQGVIVIDAQMFSATARQVLRKIAEVTPAAVNTVILTHSDPDHVNGLPGYPRGVEIYAHQNTRTDMLAALADQEIRRISRPSPAVRDYLPTRLIEAHETLEIDGVHLELLHVAPAHTDGDLIVYLPAQKLVFAGDLLAPNVGPYPGIHSNKHGSSLGWMQFIRAMLALDADIFISGHGEPQSREQVLARLRAAEQRRAQIKALVDEGKSLPDVKAALQDPAPTGVARMFPTYTETTYDELVGVMRPAQ